MFQSESRQNDIVMESLEAELLLVTDNPGSRKNASDGSESGDEFDGVSDSDVGDDEDPALDDVGEDDEEDDDEYGIDDDEDDDYGSKRKSKKKSSRSKSKSTSRTTSSKSRSKSLDNRAPSKMGQTAIFDGEQDNEERFHFKYDENGYGDSVDRESLSKMSEVDRERLLTKRQDDRAHAYYLWKKRNEMKARGVDVHAESEANRSRSSGRLKSTPKSDALQALAEDKRKKTSRALEIDISDADSEQDRPSEKPREETKEEPELPSVKEDNELLREDGPDLCYKDLVTIGSDGNARTSPLFLRRDTLFQLSQLPFFGRVVEGLYVRLKVGDNQSNNAYLLCRIAGLKTHRVYQLIETDYRTNQRLLLQSGKQRREFEINQVSGSHPTEREFDEYIDRARHGSIEIPRRDEVERLLKQSLKWIVDRNVTATEEETKRFIANMEIVYPARVNWTRKRTEVETAIDIKRQELINARDRGQEETVLKYANEIREMSKKLEEIREYEAKYVFRGKKTNVQVFESLAERNQKLNATNESLAASRRNFESNKATVDLFSRFDATGQSYFTIGADDGRNAGPLSEQAKDVYTGYDWRKDLSTWDPCAKRRKISDSPIDPAFGVSLPGLDNFSIDFARPIEPKRSVSFIPPGVDAIYDRPTRHFARPPVGTKILSFDEWSKQRAA